MKTINWGMVGTGDVTEVKSGPALYKADNSRLLGVTNRTLTKAHDYANRHGIETVYSDIDDMLADERIDIVYLATPPSSHKELALKCAAAGVPCYIEKPVSLTYVDGLEMLNAFEATDTPAFAAYYRRALPRFVKVKELIDDGAIGDVRLVRIHEYRPPNPSEADGSSWRVHGEISGGGIFMDVAVHALDFIDYAVGPISNVRGFTVNQGGLYDVEDTVSIAYEFERGAQGTGDWCFVAGVRSEYIEIIGTSGAIKFQCFGTGTVVQIMPDGEQIKFDLPTPAHVHQPLVQTIVDELNGVGKCPSTLSSALRTAWVADKVYGR